MFVGDAGTTEASLPSSRHGVEFSNRYIPLPWLPFDLDLAWSRAHFRDDDRPGRSIPGAVTRVGSFAMTIRDTGPWSATVGLRLPRSATPDRGRQRHGRVFTLANLRVGYRVSREVQTYLDVFNLLDRRANDIEYYYESRLTGEAAPVADRHFHPVEPRTIRLSGRVTL